MSTFIPNAGNWHASFKSEDAMLILAVSDAVARAGGIFTVVHDAQRSATWLKTWTAKCIQAKGVIVGFTDAYRANFTDALKQEASVILALYNAGKIKLFILDPSDGSNASNVRSNIQDDSAGMGDIDAWVAFVTQNGVVENTEVAGTAGESNEPLGSSGGGGGGGRHEGKAAPEARPAAETPPDAPVFQAEVLKKPRVRGMIRIPGGVRWDTRFIRLYHDRLEYGTVVSFTNQSNQQ